MSDSYLVEVKPSVLVETSLQPSDFDEISNLSLSEQEYEDKTIMEFVSRKDAETWVQSNQFVKGVQGAGRLYLHNAHPKDESEVDAYLLFKPFTSKIIQR